MPASDARQSILTDLLLAAHSQDGATLKDDGETSGQSLAEELST